MHHKKLGRSYSVVIASHIYATGPALELEEYLKDKVDELTFIGHPFGFAQHKNSFYRTYKNNKLLKEHKITVPIPKFLFYFRDAFFTFWWTINHRGKVDLFIGSDNFLAFIGIVLKSLGKVDNVILYTIDFLPERFGSPILNRLYHYFDKMCMKHCLAIWNVSAAIADAREKHSHLKAKRYAPQIVVPLGIWYDRIPKIPHTKRQKGRIVFMGHLLEKQGLQKVIEAMPEVIKKIPKAHLVVIGSGDYEQKLKDLVVTKKLSSHVKFLGFIESHKKVEEELCKSTLAVATYVPDPKSFTYFADPGKIKNYLAAGLPVMLTDVPPIAKSIAKEKSAILCSYDSGDIAKKITDLLTDQNKLVNYSKNATNYAKQFDWNIVFKKALDSSLQ